jgi:hypothetical protein
MNWKNLKLNLCPKCRASLKNVSNGKECSNKICGFFITTNKLLLLNDDFDRGDRNKDMEGFGFE